MTAISISRKILKIIGIVLAFLLAILVSFHFWFIQHAEGLLSELVLDKSNGQLKLEVEKFRFNWLNRKMELRKAVFYTTNDSTATNGYTIEVDQLQLKLKRLYPLITEKKFLIDSLVLLSPKITVTNLRSSNHLGDTSGKRLSLAQEMGKVYNSIKDALKVLEVDRFVINNGEFGMVNKSNLLPDERPVAISRIDFRLDNLRVDSAKAASQKILFSDNVALQTSHQDISFPDGRHRLSFRNFRINLQERLAEFDSCTITARKGDADSSSFIVFFDKLKMTDIDFDTLYHKEVIKADSVYCLNPQFRLNVNLKEKALAGAPKLDELLLQLAGDLQLKFAVVENGSFDINITRKGQPNSFVSDHNNFEVQGLRVKKSAPEPVTVERFAMAIRNYENFLRDSSFSIRFDSILVYGNRISLANFVFKEYKSGHSNNQIGMPQFELYGLSWDELVFGKRLKAEHVVLYKPVINYTVKSSNGKPVNIFNAFHEINKLLQLHNLSIASGEVNLEFGKNAKLKLNNVTSFIAANQLVKAFDINSTRQAVDALTFSAGNFSMNGLSVQLKNTSISKSGDHLQADAIEVVRKNKMNIHAADIRINAILFDEENQLLTVNGLTWNNGNVKFFVNDNASKKTAGLNIKLLNVKGKRTNVQLLSPSMETSFLVEDISTEKINYLNEKITTEQLSVSGQHFQHKKDNTLITIEQFKLNDDRPSKLTNVFYTEFKANDSTRISLPAITAKANISAMLNDRFVISSIEIPNPSVYIHSRQKVNREDESKSKTWPRIQVNLLHLKQPEIHINSVTEKGPMQLEWRGDENNFLTLENLSSDTAEAQGLNIRRLSFVLNGLLFKNAQGKIFRTKTGNITAAMENLQAKKDDANAWDWNGRLVTLVARNFLFDSLDKTGGMLNIKTAKLSNLMLSSSFLLSPHELAKRNPSLLLEEISGSYQNSLNIFDWHNLRFDGGTKELGIDSFSYLPRLTREQFMLAHPYQTDYAKVRTGAIQISGANLETFLKDTILDLRSITVHDGWLDDFRDQRLPRQPGLVRPLPVAHLKKFPIKLHIDSLFLLNTKVRYGEYNEKTDAAGWINIHRLNGLIANIRNYDTKPGDSLTIIATAWLEDSVFTALQVRGSYLDPMQGFLMNVQMGSADLRVLNPALGPLAGASLKSGHLDTMTMQVKGNNMVAYGEMTMLYNDLKVIIAGKPNEDKRPILTRVLNSLVNIILKNKNTGGREGVVFFERLQDRSAFNYLVKITLSGVGSSVGLGKDKRQLRRYMRREKRKERVQK